MKLDRLNEFVMATTVVVLGVVAAIMCGRLAGTGQNSWLWIGAAAVIYIITCFTLRSNIWLLIPMFWICSGQLNSVPGHLPFRDLIVIGAVGYFFTLKAFKVIKTRPKYTWLDIFLWVNLLYVVSLYLRFPVGVNAFGSDIVGGRVYLEIIFAVGGYWVLNQVMITPKQAKIFPLLLCAVSGFLAVVNTITYIFPSTAPTLGKLYGGVDPESYRREESGEAYNEEDVRTEYLAGVGASMSSLGWTYFSPLTLINPMYIWRFLLMVVAFIFCLKSGHRITMPSMAITLLLAAYFRRGMAAAFIIMLIAIPPAVLVIAGQGTLYELPESAQRTLCFLPGKWDPEVVNSAEDSTDWRLQMWDMMWHDPKYLHNKVFGDGFGFTREELESMAEHGTQEDFLLTNDVHSGPMSTLHAEGCIGLALFLLMFFAAARRAWRLIRGSAGTPFYPSALFVGIGTIYGMFSFVAVFGDIKNDLPNMVLTVGMLNLLTRGLAAYRKSTEPEVQVPILRKTIQPLAPIPVHSPALH